MSAFLMFIDVCIYFFLKVAAMNEFADRLCGEGHYESGEIRRRQQAVLERRSKVKGAAVERRNRLEDCRKLMVFLQNVMEVSALQALCMTII